jgi:hypothetical protein
LKGQSPLAYRTSPDRLGDAALASRYQPLLLHARGERWFPTAVDSYLAGAELRGSRGGRLGSKLKPSTLAHFAGCRRRPRVRCFRLTIRCATGDDECAADRAQARPASYYRVIRARPGEPKPRELVPGSPMGAVDAVVQYWLFYRYDDWKSRGGGFRQWHEADWEVVTIGLSEPPGAAPAGDDPRLLFVGFSQHCGGHWRPVARTLGGTLAVPDPRIEAETAAWRRPPKKPRRLQAGIVHGSHPIAYVALGSHALYPTPVPRVPNWAECKDLKLAGTLLGPSYSAGAREGMEYAGPGARPAPDLADHALPPLKRVDGGTNFMRFAGFWGAGDETHLLGLPAATGDGPETPALKPLWKHPLETIFCSRHWRPTGSCSRLQQLAPSKKPTSG